MLADSSTGCKQRRILLDGSEGLDRRAELAGPDSVIGVLCLAYCLTILSYSSCTQRLEAWRLEQSTKKRKSAS